jgi:hypothetical protein
LDQHRYRELPDIEPDIEPDIGIRYMPISGCPIFKLNPILKPISVFYTCRYQDYDRIPDIDPNIDPNIGYLIADIVSWCPDIGSHPISEHYIGTIGPDIGKHPTLGHQKYPNIRYILLSTRYPENPEIRCPDIGKIPDIGTVKNPDGH